MIVRTNKITNCDLNMKLPNNLLTTDEEISLRCGGKKVRVVLHGCHIDAEGRPDNLCRNRDCVENHHCRSNRRYR